MCSFPDVPMVLFIRPVLPQKTLFPSWVCEIGLLVLLLCKESVYQSWVWLKSCSISKTHVFDFFHKMHFKFVDADSTAAAETALVDLPELVLECILAKLSPAELCKMSCACRSLRERCGKDHLWERHVKEKWSRVLGEAALRKWEMRASKRGLDNGGGPREGNGMWPLPWFKRQVEGGRQLERYRQAASALSFYVELEGGRFSFPAQVYNRENGSAGFLLSCYDAEISYNSRRDFFYARYPSHGKRIPAIEEVTWEKIRAPPVDTSPHLLHISDCLSNLYPGDHVEIQWRKNKEFPYGWWFGVIGHLEMCDQGQLSCFCHSSDTIVIEFNHYASGSSWRRKMIDRKEQREDGDEHNGFYGGIRKLQKQDDISMWMQFWPSDASN